MVVVLVVLMLFYPSPLHLPAAGGDGHHQQPHLPLPPHPGETAGQGRLCWVSPAGRGLWGTPAVAAALQGEGQAGQTSQDEDGQDDSLHSIRLSLMSGNHARQSGWPQIFLTSPHLGPLLHTLADRLGEKQWERGGAGAEPGVDWGVHGQQVPLHHHCSLTTRSCGGLETPGRHCSPGHSQSYQHQLTITPVVEDDFTKHYYYFKLVIVSLLKPPVINFNILCLFPN